MKHPFSHLIIGLVVAFTAQATLANEAQTEASNSYIFLFEDSVDSMDIEGLAASLTTSHNGSLRYVYSNTIKGFSADISRDDATSLVNNNQGIVDRFVDNGVVSFNAAGGAKKGVKFTADEISSWGATFVGSQDATAGSIERHAWIIDTGIDDYWGDKDLKIGEGANFVLKGQDTTDDVNGHGTHIAGILAAKNNDTGVLGVAAGATVHPVRVLHKNLWGTTDAIMKGVDYVAEMIGDDAYKDDIHVVNMSLTMEIAGQEDTVGVIELAINKLTDYGNNDVKVAVCAGNDGTYAGDYSPARMSMLPNSNVYTVASIAQGPSLASDSNYGAPPISFVAPGVAIESLKPGGGTWFWSGCSMATPHVAGILLFGTPNPNETVSSDGIDYDIAGF